MVLRIWGNDDTIYTFAWPFNLHSLPFKPKIPIMHTSMCNWWSDMHYVSFTTSEKWSNANIKVTNNITWTWISSSTFVPWNLHCFCIALVEWNLCPLSSLRWHLFHRLTRTGGYGRRISILHISTGCISQSWHGWGQSRAVYWILPTFGYINTCILQKKTMTFDTWKNVFTLSCTVFLDVWKLYLQ